MDRYNIALGKEIPPAEQEEQIEPPYKKASEIPHEILGENVTITDSRGNKFEGFVQECSLSMESSMSGPQALIPGQTTTRLQMDIVIHRYTLVKPNISPPTNFPYSMLMNDPLF